MLESDIHVISDAKGTSVLTMFAASALTWALCDAKEEEGQVEGSRKHNENNEVNNKG